MRRIRLTQIDGKLPNLALMKLAHWHRSRGDEIHFTKSVAPELFEPREYDVVFGSAIFSYSANRVAELQRNFPGALVGGTWNISQTMTVETHIGRNEYEHSDYSIYPNFPHSIGFTQRGCRLKCKFCVVPQKEGRPRSVNSIGDIWRGEPFPKQIHLLDNDFFGQSEWRARVNEIRDGGFKVCLNQGINIRLINEEAAEALASIKYYDDSFKTRRLYTAWDNLKDEKVFFRGVDLLERAGVPSTHLMVYMLVGFDPRETWGRVMYRLEKMVARGIRPYPMVFGDRNATLPVGETNQNIRGRTLGEFQRWVIRQSYNFIPFEDYDVNAKGRLNGPMQESML